MGLSNITEPLGIRSYRFALRMHMHVCDQAEIMSTNQIVGKYCFSLADMSNSRNPTIMMMLQNMANNNSAHDSH